MNPESNAPAVVRADESKQNVFERLEYGKLCRSADGPVVKGVECRKLASSPGFDSSVAELCDPSQSDGISLGLQDDRPRDQQFSHGTLICPVLLPAERVAQVGCRLRRRPEDGEGGIERRYWMGRYLLMSEAAQDPRCFFHAFESEPVRGLCQEDLDLHAVPILTSERPPTAEAKERFLAQALAYAISGVPIGIRGPIEEVAFFDLASALWWLLPTPLRRLYCVGWGVSEALAPALNLSAAARFPSVVATFGLIEMTWARPTEVDPVVGPRGGGRFDSGVTLPGRMYVREATSRGEQGQMIFQPPEAMHNLTHAIQVELPSVTSARSLSLNGRPPLAVTFRSFGFYALDRARFTVLQRWLSGESIDDEATLCISSADFISPPFIDLVPEHAVQALIEPGSRGRGERVLWASLQGVHSARHRAKGLELTGPGAGRLDFLLHLADARTPVLPSLLAMIDAEEADGLTDEVMRALELRLDQSLTGDPGAPRAHLRALTRVPIPEPYLRWARSRLDRLALFYLQSHDRTRSDGLEALEQLGGVPAISMLRRLTSFLAPTVEDQVLISSLDDDIYQACGQLLEVSWRSTAQGDHCDWRRDRLVPWLRSFSEIPFNDPLIKLARGEEAGKEAVDVICDAVVHREMPTLLFGNVALELLRHWPSYAPRVKLLPWREVLEYLPLPFRVLVLETSAAERANPADPKLEEAARQVSLNQSDLEKIIHQQKARRSSLSETLVFSWLWSWTEWARPDYESRASVVGLCQGLRRGNLPFDDIPPSESSLTLELILRSGGQSSLLEHRERLWQKAQSSTQIRFILELFVGDDLIPTATQLDAMARDAAWLRRHVKSANVHRDRHHRFKLSLSSFHEFHYATERDWPFEPEYRDTVLWIQYAGVPPHLQGALKIALDWLDNDESSLRRLKLASRYLHDQEGSNEEGTQSFAARQVLQGAILPAWRNADASVDELERAFECFSPEGLQRTGLRRGIHDAWQAVSLKRRREILEVPELERPVAGSSDLLKVHGSLRGLMSSVAKYLDRRDLSAIIRGKSEGIVGADKGSQRGHGRNQR